MGRQVYILLFCILVLTLVAGVSSFGDNTAAKKDTPSEKADKPENKAEPELDDKNIPPFVQQKMVLKEGEKLVYAIKWNGLEAGRSVMKVIGTEKTKDGREVYRLECETRSNAWVSKIYPVKDKFVSLVDKEGSYSHRFEKSLHEGSRNRDIVMDYDYKNKEVRCEIKWQDKEPQQKKIELKDFSTDVYSAIFYLRHFAGKMKVGEQVHIPVHDDEKGYRSTLVVLREEKINLAATGVREAVVVEPKASSEGLFVSSGKALLWLDKKTNIILKAEVKIPIGVAKIVLLKATDSPLNEKKEEKKDEKKEKAGKDGKDK